MANGQLYAQNVPKSPRNQQQHEAVPQLGTATCNIPDHEQTLARCRESKRNPTKIFKRLKLCGKKVLELLVA
jgi:hypothetical protein